MKQKYFPLGLIYHLPFWPPTGWYLWIFLISHMLVYTRYWQDKYQRPAIDSHEVIYTWSGIQESTVEEWSRKR